MLTSEKFAAHAGICSGLAFLSSDQVVSAGDDQKLIVRDIQTGQVQSELTLGDNTYPIDLDVIGDRHKKSQTVALGASDGKVSLFTVQSGQVRFEKKWTAHQGACIRCITSPSGAELLTCGEDGLCKVWSRNGLLRTQLASTGQAIYAAAWAPDGSAVVLSEGTKLVTRSLQASARHECWNGHAALITALSWSGGAGLIASGSEAGRYKLWDRHGRLLFQSAALSSHPITSLAFSPFDALLIGSFNSVYLCDASGAVVSSIADRHSGSIFRLKWSSDARVAVGASGTGKVVRVDVAGIEVEDETHALRQLTPKRIEVTEVENNAFDQIETNERILAISTGFRHIIAVTTQDIQVFQKGTF